jgi:hypothetical protein
MKHRDADGTAYERSRPQMCATARQHARKIGGTVVQRAAGNTGGRPKVGDCRIETVVPRAVFDALKAEELATNTYRTRIAANVLCEWASRTTGHPISPHDKA